MVRDNGAGIDAAHLDKIFDPFFTTKPIGDGTGLGLSTMLGIVRSHAGFVQVQTAVGQGTRFRVFLPVSETGAAVAVAAAVATTLPQGHGEQVLVVDDEAHLRHMIRRFLEGNGYHVIEAQDGAEALQLLEHMSALPQVLVTDLMMPRMDGPTLIRAVRQKKLALKIIALGGLPPPPDTMLELGLSRQTFIAKPFDSVKLLNALHDVLA